MRRFADKVVVITGGGAGIGRVYATRFAAEGASIVIADLDGDVGDRAVSELRADGVPALAVQMDVVDDEAAAAMVARAVDEFSGVDVLVNNAGIHVHHAKPPITREGLAQWRRVLDVNVIGALNCTIACRDSMRSRGGGVVLNQSSTAAWRTEAAYDVSKLALNSLTAVLAGHLGADNIRVVGIAPGLVDSQAALDSLGEAGISALLDRQVIKRLGRMDDLADTALFLCSEEASFITGATVVVDGGFSKKAF